MSASGSLLRVHCTTMMVWVVLLLAFMMVSDTSGFHYAKAPLATVRRMARHAPSSTSSRSSSSSTSMELKYSSEAVDSSSSSSSSLSQQQQRWWKTLLPMESVSTSTKTSSKPETQQESVDAYLEFLDRRYRRLHSDEMEQGKQQQQQAQSSKPIPFSAMDWLMNGNPGANSGESHQQGQRKHEDALYVLGVAGLASQKLLQKHHLDVAATSGENPNSVHTERNDNSDVIEVTAEEDGQAISSTPSHVFIRKVLVPMIRAFYVVQRRKELVFRSIQQRAARVASKAAHRAVRPVALRWKRGPKAIFEAFLEFGGGKRNIVLTLACVYATILLVQPILQAAVAEGSVRP